MTTTAAMAAVLRSRPRLAAWRRIELRSLAN
jgi:hypothetical protein